MLYNVYDKPCSNISPWATIRLQILEKFWVVIRIQALGLCTRVTPVLNKNIPAVLIGTDRTEHWCRSTLCGIISNNQDYQRQNQFNKIYHNIKVSHHTIVITNSKINFEKVHKYKSITRISIFINCYKKNYFRFFSKKDFWRLYRWLWRIIFIKGDCIVDC